VLGVALPIDTEELLSPAEQLHPLFPAFRTVHVKQGLRPKLWYLPADILRYTEEFRTEQQGIRATYDPRATHDQMVEERRQREKLEEERRCES
jgi:hypothetical protein